MSLWKVIEHGSIWMDMCSCSMRCLSHKCLNGGASPHPCRASFSTSMLQEGDQVEQGQPLMVLEAMKMEHRILARAIRSSGMYLGASVIVLTKMSSSSSSIPSIPKAPEPTVGHSRHRSEGGRARGSSDRPCVA